MNFKHPFGRENRTARDFYETPPSAIRELLNLVEFPSPVWEPACGKGAISAVLKERGLSVVSSDLYDYGFGSSGVDFLSVFSEFPSVITNPPYELHIEFIEHGLEVATHKLALLLPLTHLRGVGRTRLLESTPLDQVLILVRNPKFVSGGKICRKVSYAWFVWDHHKEPGPPEIIWLWN